LLLIGLPQKFKLRPIVFPFRKPHLQHPPIGGGAVVHLAGARMQPLLE
jgi:hypothetical protein